MNSLVSSPQCKDLKKLLAVILITMVSGKIWIIQEIKTYDYRNSKIVKSITNVENDYQSAINLEFVLFFHFKLLKLLHIFLREGS